VNSPAGRQARDGFAVDVTPRKLIAFGLFVALTVVGLYFLLPQLAGLDDTWDRIRTGEPFYLVLCGVFTLLMFIGFVLQFHRTYHGANLTPKESLQITLAALAATRLFSAGGAGGLVLQAWALRKAGLEARTVADRSVTFIVTQYLWYTVTVVLFGYALYFGVLPGNAPFAITFVPATLALAVTIVGLSLGFVPPDLQKRIARAQGKGWIQKLSQLPASASAGIRSALKMFADRDLAILGAFTFWAAQIACLWAAFDAFGEAPPLAVLVVGFFVGMLGNLLPLPGGIGGVDGGMIGAFAAFGVKGDLALVAVLTYRGFTFWLPTVPGVVAFFALRKTVERWELEGRPAEDTDDAVTS
jgi:uncharacterized protein (TIRG00374 family)